MATLAPAREQVGMLLEHPTFIDEAVCLQYLAGILSPRWNTHGTAEAVYTAPNIDRTLQINDCYGDAIAESVRVRVVCKGRIRVKDNGAGTVEKVDGSTADLTAYGKELDCLTDATGALALRFAIDDGVVPSITDYDEVAAGPVYKIGGEVYLYFGSDYRPLPVVAFASTLKIKFTDV